MNCMKCGRKVEADQVFCDLCLEGMGNEPIKINTQVLIPTQPPKTAPSHRRPMINPDEEVKRLEKQNQNLILFLILTTVGMCLFALATFHQEFFAVVDNLGRNYSVIESATGGLGH